jgi:hypothetical protein
LFALGQNPAFCLLTAVIHLTYTFPNKLFDNSQIIPGETTMSQTPVKPDRESPPSTPRWVKVLAIIALSVVLLIIIALVTDLGGPHGPGRHMPSGEPAGYIAAIGHGGEQL